MEKFFWCKAGLFALEGVLAPFGDCMFASGTKTHLGHGGVRRWLLGADAHWRLSCQSKKNLGPALADPLRVLSHSRPAGLMTCQEGSLHLFAMMCPDDLSLPTAALRQPRICSAPQSSPNSRVFTLRHVMAAVDLFCAGQTSTSCERARRTASWACVFQADVNIRSSSAACL